MATKANIILLLAILGEISAKDLLYHPHSTHHSSENDVELRYGLEPVCVDNLCYNQDECCPGTVCVTHGTAKVGLCAKYLAQSEGKLCTVASNEEQCSNDLECKPIHVSVLPLGACVNPKKVVKHKKYFEPCETTIDCETSAKLCCRMLTPAKGKHQKVCSYYDALLEQCTF